MPKHILILEDDILLNKVYKYSLIRSGYEVSSLVSGVGVIEVIRLQRPELIILDLVMPEKDGFMVLQELQADESMSTIPVVVLSNLSQDEDKARVMSLGAKAMFSKSEISFPEMISKLETMLA